MRAVALLRGVNVGGVRFAMKDLAAALEVAGAEDVRTVLASGNVLLTTRHEAPAQVSDLISRVIRERFGFDVGVVTASLPTVRAAAEGYPFARAEDRHAYVVLADRQGVLDELIGDGDAADPDVEQLRAGAGVLYWDAPKGATLTTRFGVLLGRRQRQGVVTTRNLRTLERVVATG